MHRPKPLSPGLASGLVIRVAFALGVVMGSYSTSSAISVTFPNCTGTTSDIGDGDCDAANNNVGCGYDGGDCCACSCLSTTLSICGRNGFDCLDPEVGDPVPGCEVIPAEPPKVSPCVAGTPRRWVVETTAEANSLADSILCSGGVFEVEWRGYIHVNRTFYVIDGTILDVVGRSDAVADGGGTTQLVSAVNGTLRVSDLQMSNGIGIYGGAISATRRSEVTLTRVNFTSNTAEGFGGAINVENSYLELANSSIFKSNSAIYGGAIYLANSSTLMQRMGSGQMYRFEDNGATDGGALYVTGNSRVAGDTRNHSTGTTSSDMSSSSGEASSTGSATGYASNIYASDFDYSAGSYFTVGATSTQTIFIKNNAQSSGGAVYMDGWSTWFLAGETTFEGNSAENGGALFMGGGLIIEWQGVTLFYLNHARIHGGAVASAVDAPSPYVYLYGAVSFLNNTCGGSGGALALFGDMDFRWGDTAPQFVGNSAVLFGGAVYISDATYGHQFPHARFTENQAQNGGAVFAAGCGTAETPISSDVPILHPTNFSNCTFVGNTALEAGGALKISIGRAHVENTEFIGNTASEGGALRLFGTVELFNSSFSDNRSGEGGGSAISNVGIVLETVGLSFSANRFLCAATEYVDFSEGNSRYTEACQGCNTTCQGCVIEDNTSVPACTAMFDHAQSESGTATIEGVMVDPGYWRANNQSKNVLSCYNTDACLGGLTGGPDYCSDGYEGPYCSVCSEGYRTTLAFRCRQCSDGNSAVVFVVLAIVFLAALAFVWHMVSIEKEDSTRGVVVRVEKVVPLQSIKIIIVAWQIVTQFSSLANVIYPESYQLLLDVVALVNFDMGWMLSAGCIVDVDFHDGLLMATVGPFTVITLLGITYIVAINRNRGSEVALHAIRRKHLGAAVLLTFVVYSSVSSAVFRTFACDELDDGSVYLRTDYRIECDSPRHKAFKVFAGLMVIVYPIGIPLFYTVLLFREHNKMMQGLDFNTPRYDSTSTLRKPYRPSVFYYEVVECSRRFLLTCVLVFISPSTVAQIAVTTVIAFTFVLVSEGLSPYESRWDSWVSRAGNIIVLLSMYVALLIRVDVSNESEHDQNIYAQILVGAHAITISLVIMESVALVYSVRSIESSLPVPHSSSTKTVRAVDSSASIEF